MRLFDSKNQFRRVLMILSKILLRVHSREMGRYEGGGWAFVWLKDGDDDGNFPVRRVGSFGENFVYETCEVRYGVRAEFVEEDWQDLVDTWC